MQEFKSLADLLDLQEVDLQIDRLLTQRTELPELAQYKAAHKASEKAVSRLESVTAESKDISMNLDKNEGELEILETKIDQSELRLFAGGLSAKEADNLRLDIESQKRRQSDMETEVLTYIDQFETVSAQVTEGQSLVESTAAEVDRLEALVSEEWRKIDGELTRREERKAALVAIIDEDLLPRYEKLRISKDGVAVSRLADGTCGGCHLVLSAAEQAEAAQDDPPRCIHCLRLLVI